MRAFRHEDNFSLPLPTVEHTRPRFDLQNICIHALCHCGGNSPLKVAHTQARAGARFLEITSLYCLISSRGSRHVPCIFSGAGTRPLSASSCKSALISNNQGEVPLPRQSRATSHIFLAHRPALHHVLIIATTTDVTLERQRVAALGAEVKTAKLYIRSFCRRLGVSKMKQRESQSECAQADHIPNFSNFLFSYICRFSQIIDRRWSGRIEPSGYIIGLSAASLYPAVMNGSALVLPHQQTGFPVALSINAL